MSQRFIEILVPDAQAARLRDLLKENEQIVAMDDPADDLTPFKVLVSSEHVEKVLDPVQAAFSGTQGFRAVVLRVEASLPLREESKADEADKREAPPEKLPERISREELYEDISGYARVTRVFLCLVVLSTIVAAVGIARGSAAILIGAMVIAPLLGPNMALALATALGDAPLARQAIKTNAVGIALAFVVAFLASMVLEVDSTSTEIISRTNILLGDLVLALAAGVAGALAFTSGVSTSLVGVMVAVALLPPLTIFAMLLAAERTSQATGALLLLTTNIVCINLAGVSTFLVQGISPRRWWEAKKSKRLARKVLAVWILLLVALGVLVTLSGKRHQELQRNSATPAHGLQA